VTRLPALQIPVFNHIAHVLLEGRRIPPHVMPQPMPPTPLALSPTTSLSTMCTIKRKLKRAWHYLTRAFRLLTRSLLVASLATPYLLTYPLTPLSPTFHTLWLRSCCHTVEFAGAAFIKLAQWASSRPDMFGAGT